MVIYKEYRGEYLNYILSVFCGCSIIGYIEYLTKPKSWHSYISKYKKVCMFDKSKKENYNEVT